MVSGTVTGSVSGISQLDRMVPMTKKSDDGKRDLVLDAETDIAESGNSWLILTLDVFRANSKRVKVGTNTGWEYTLKKIGEFRIPKVLMSVQNAEQVLWIANAYLAGLGEENLGKLHVVSSLDGEKWLNDATNYNEPRYLLRPRYKAARKSRKSEVKR